MRRVLAPPLLSLLLATGTACVTAPATMGSLPRERATECVANCEQLGMKLSAVVVISNSAGCVCEPKDAQAPAPRAGAAAAAGGAAIVAQWRQRQGAATPGGPALHGAGRPWSPVGPHR